MAAPMEKDGDIGTGIDANPLATILSQALGVPVPKYDQPSDTDAAISVPGMPQVIPPSLSVNVASKTREQSSVTGSSTMSVAQPQDSVSLLPQEMQLVSDAPSNPSSANIQRCATVETNQGVQPMDSKVCWPTQARTGNRIILPSRDPRLRKLESGTHVDQEDPPILQNPFEGAHFQPPSSKQRQVRPLVKCAQFIPLTPITSLAPLSDQDIQTECDTTRDPRLKVPAYFQRSSASHAIDLPLPVMKKQQSDTLADVNSNIQERKGGLAETEVPSCSSGMVSSILNPIDILLLARSNTINPVDIADPISPNCLTDSGNFSFFSTQPQENEQSSSCNTEHVTKHGPGNSDTSHAPITAAVQDSSLQADLPWSGAKRRDASLHPNDNAEDDIITERSPRKYKISFSGRNLNAPAPKNVLERMQVMGMMQGPMSLLHRSIKERLRIKVWTRSATHIRGICTGFLVAFDKHWNLALRDVDEVFRRATKKKKQTWKNVAYLQRPEDRVPTDHDSDDADVEPTSHEPKNSTIETTASQQAVMECGENSDESKPSNVEITSQNYDIAVSERNDVHNATPAVATQVDLPAEKDNLAHTSSSQDSDHNLEDGVSGGDQSETIVLAPPDTTKIAVAAPDTTGEETSDLSLLTDQLKALQEQLTALSAEESDGEGSDSDKEGETGKASDLSGGDHEDPTPKSRVDECENTKQRMRTNKRATEGSGHRHQSGGGSRHRSEDSRRKSSALAGDRRRPLSPDHRASGYREGRRHEHRHRESSPQSKGSPRRHHQSSKYEDHKSDRRKSSSKVDDLRNLLSKKRQKQDGIQEPISRRGRSKQSKSPSNRYNSPCEERQKCGRSDAAVKEAADSDHFKSKLGKDAYIPAGCLLVSVEEGGDMILQRHVGQMMIRGDNVVMVALVQD